MHRIIHSCSCSQEQFTPWIWMSQVQMLIWFLRKQQNFNWASELQFLSVPWLVISGSETPSTVLLLMLAHAWEHSGAGDTGTPSVMGLLPKPPNKPFPSLAHNRPRVCSLQSHLPLLEVASRHFCNVLQGSFYCSLKPWFKEYLTFTVTGGCWLRENQ